MSNPVQPFTINDLRGGRNGVDPPLSLSDRYVAEALNGDFYNASVFRKRAGAAVLTTTASPFTGKLSSLARHVPSTDETVAELWGSDDAATPNIGRLTGGTAWATPTLKDVPTGNGFDMSYASLNGNLYIAYKSGVDRLHVWDLVSGQVRRTGVAAMAVPTVANTGAGTYAATLRYYRTRATVQSAGVTIRRSEASPSVSFTPSGAGTAARVTQGTVPNELETHWEVEASTDNTSFFRIATVVIATTTYDDSAATSTYNTNPVSAAIGTYALQKSYKYIAVDQNRLLGFGAYTSTNKQARVEFSAVAGSSDISDVERVPTTNYLDLDENDSGVATGIIGPVNSSYFAFKYRQVWKLVPTGDATTPYNALAVSKKIGSVGPAAIKVGEDEIGNATVYWMSHKGPYRYGTRSLEYLGKPLEDRLLPGGAISSMNLAASNVVCHAQWYDDKRQLWFWYATGASNDPDTIAKFGVGRYKPFNTSNDTETAIPDAWSIDTGNLAAARCAVLFSNTVGATMSRDLKPYIGSTTANNTIWKTDTGTQDQGTSFATSITTKQYMPWGRGFSGAIMGAEVIALAATGVTLQLSVIKDGAIETRTDTVDLTPGTGETVGKRVVRRFGGGITIAGARWVQFTLGDVAAANNSWQVDELIISTIKEGPIAA